MRGWHSSRILPQRQKVLAEHFARIIESDMEEGGGAEIRIVDVGSGDGQIGAAVQGHLGKGEVCGYEIRPRGGEQIPTTEFDGRCLPEKDSGADYCLLCDVLHHIPDGAGQKGLLEECLRVAKRGVIVKDHFETTLFSRVVLTAMDITGNVWYGVTSPGTYFNPQNWISLCHQLEVVEKQHLRSPLGLHPKWIAWLTDRKSKVGGLHFISLLKRQEPSERAGW